MELNDIRNSEKIAIVVVGYNRLYSIKRLLNSLLKAQYPSGDVPIYISIDASGDNELYDFVNDFKWPHGDKYVNIQKDRLGLKNHIIQCGDLTKYFKAVVLLEDDIFVSPYFYKYVEEAVEYYKNEERIAGISLINSEFGFPGLHMATMLDGSDTYLKQFPASWGECWTRNQWLKFKQWYDHFSDDRFPLIDIPKRAKGWKNAWSKYFMAYMVETGRYFVYPNVSLTTCFGDAGVHSDASSSSSQVNLLQGVKTYFFRNFDDMVKYDIFGTNERIYQWVGISKDELTVDWYGTNESENCKKYLLTTSRMPYPKLQTFGLQMRPIELNILYKIEGGDIFLYDTTNIKKPDKSNHLSISLAFYCLRSFNVHLAARFVIHNGWQMVCDKLKSWR